MAKIDSLEQERQESYRAFRAEHNKLAREKLAASLEAARKAQEQLIADATKLKTVSEATKSEGQGLWASLVKVAKEGKAAGIETFVIVELIETELGNTDEIDKRARATVSAYRGTIGSMLGAMKLNEGKAWQEARKVRGIEANKADADLGYLTVRKVISAVTKGDERLKFEQAFAAFSTAIRNAAKNSPADKEAGTPAYNAVPYADLTAFLNDVTKKVPERSVKKADGDSTKRTRTELEAGDAESEANLQRVANG